MGLSSSKVCAFWILVIHHSAGPLFVYVTPDFHHIDLLAHFDRERIPERVVCILNSLDVFLSDSCLESFRSMPRVPVHMATLK